MSKNFEKIKKYYDTGMWPLDRVQSVVNKDLGITPEEFKLITGKEYK